jgi:hypothetical protein
MCPPLRPSSLRAAAPLNRAQAEQSAPRISAAPACAEDPPQWHRLGAHCRACGGAEENWRAPLSGWLSKGQCVHPAGLSFIFGWSTRSARACPPGGMVECYPALILEQVNGALAFYLASQNGIDTYLAEGQRASHLQHDESKAIECGIGCETASSAGCESHSWLMPISNSP